MKGFERNVGGEREISGLAYNASFGCGEGGGELVGGVNSWHISMGFCPPSFVLLGRNYDGMKPMKDEAIPKGRRSDVATRWWRVQHALVPNQSTSGCPPAQEGESQQPHERGLDGFIHPLGGSCSFSGGEIPRLRFGLAVI